jgi:hypothetical protein
MDGVRLEVVVKGVSSSCMDRMDRREPKTDETGRPPLLTLKEGRVTGLGEGRVFAEVGEGSSSWASSGEDSRLVTRVGPRRFFRVLFESLLSLSGESRVVVVVG